MTKNKPKNGTIAFLADFFPLLVFFGIYKSLETPNALIVATIGLIIATAIGLIINYLVNKEIAKTALFSAIILAFFGGLTIFSGSETFIKIKPTLVNLLFSAILFAGYFLDRPMLKILLGQAFEIGKKDWHKLSLRWGWFFIALAILNEIIWRNMPTDFWVKFKVFGFLPISIIFTLSQVPFIMKAAEKYKKENNESQ